MKSALLGIALFFKRPNIINRLILGGGAAMLAWLWFIPDLTYNLTLKNPPKMTIDQVVKTPTDQLPRYIVLTDAMMSRSEQSSDALFAQSAIQALSPQAKEALRGKLKVLSYGYVMEQSVKKNDTTMSAIYYPVYPKTDSKENTIHSASGLTANIVIKDSKATEAQLKDDVYFKDSTFTFSGEFDGQLVTGELKRLLDESGYQVSNKAVVLQKGNTPIALGASIFLTVAALFVAFFVLLSFVPTNMLYRWLGFEPEIVRVEV
ncbi:hypothetical protein [Fibrella aquatilis]|uniref:Uncharacterized protein n=1 Tax=Fibrella aquatilis TaxID=2817059 RepID=A0A939JYV7_9BACT|nr:hypothetical protein [Fibrella aquatilis]MBO0934402.1 hypothetical protein [Fibrella aquatilis]